MLFNVSCLDCRLLTFFKVNFFQNILQELYIRVSNGLDQYQDQRLRMTNVIRNPNTNASPFLDVNVIDADYISQCRRGSVQCLRLYCLLGFYIARIRHLE